MSRDNDRQRKESLYKEVSRDTGEFKAVTYSSQIIVQFSFSKINSLLSATSILSRSPMAYNTTASFEKLTCTNFVDSGKCQDKFGRFSWSKDDSNNLDIKPKVFKREDKNAETRLS